MGKKDDDVKRDALLLRAPRTPSIPRARGAAEKSKPSLGGAGILRTLKKPPKHGAVKVSVDSRRGILKKQTPKTAANKDKKAADKRDESY
jgi:hypothetical protein